MRVLLTGHKGYIGTVMVPMLHDAGHEVVGLDTDLYEASTFGEGMVEIPELKKDIRDVRLDDVRGFDAVFHLAGLSNDPLGDLNPDLTYEINHLASLSLARLAKEAGVPRFVFSSSCSNYLGLCSGFQFKMSKIFGDESENRTHDRTFAEFCLNRLGHLVL